MYDIFGNELKTLSLDSYEIQGNGILDARIWSNGVVCLTKNYKFLCMMNFNDPYIVPLADANILDEPICWEVIEPLQTENMTVQIAAISSQGSLLLIGINSAKETNIGPLETICISPNGKMLAFFTREGEVKVVPSDLKSGIIKFDTKRKRTPNQFVWCGADAVVCCWEQNGYNELIMIGPHESEHIIYEFEEPVVLIPDIDGIRVISNRKCEFLQKVPESTESIFSLQSQSSAKTLYQANEYFEKKDPRSDELLRSINDDLANAVTITIDAASMEYDPVRQQKLLKAASLGKIFLESYNPDKFVEVCKTLRILNQVRDYRFGIPITYSQYKVLKTPLLIERLLNRHHHALAFSICEYLGLKTDSVLIHWACCKVRMRAAELKDDESIRAFVGQIVGKLSSNPGISFADIASAAYKRNSKLATLLLDHEPRAQDQVPLLISMKQDEHALDRAIHSGDSDLIHLVILHLRRTKSFKEFMSIISRYDVSMSLFIKYCKENDLETLKHLYEIQNRPDLLAFVEVKEALMSPDFNYQKDHLKRALNLYKKSSLDMAGKATEDECRLMLYQKDLELSYNIKLIGSSLSTTIYESLLRKDKIANKLAKEFKVPDKRFWWLKIRSLAEIGDWEELERFSKEKSPIGYSPFADVCINARNYKEAAKYIRRIKEPSIRTKYFVKIEAFNEAFESAVESRDPEMLVLVGRSCKDPAIVSQIEAKLGRG